MCVSREAICNGRRLSKIREEIVQKGSFSVDVGGRRLAAKDRAAPKANSTDQRTANANAIASRVSVAVSISAREPSLVALPAFWGGLWVLFLGVGGLAVVCWLLRGVGCSMPWMPWSCVLPTGATRFPASTLPFLMHCISMYWILLWVVCYVSGVNTTVCLSLRSLAFTPRTYLHGGKAPLTATHGSFCQALSEFSFTRRCRWFFLCFLWTCCKWYMQLAAGDPWIQWTSCATSIFRWLRGPTTCSNASLLLQLLRWCLWPAWEG